MLSLGLALLVMGTASVCAGDEPVKLGDLPKVVASAVKVKFPKGAITKAVKDEENGKTVYELVVEVEGKKLDVVVSAEGKLLEVEAAIAADKLPRAVAATLAARYPEARIKKAEQIVKFEDDEEEKLFEVVLATAGKADVEVKISPKGKIIP
jgi:NCAIR mutase (PurE)-related protein